MKKILAVLAALVMSFVMLGAAPASAGSLPNLKECDGVYGPKEYPNGFKNVTVQPGDTCVLKNGLTVTGGVHAKKGAKNLIVRTSVGRNVQANGVTGLVHIGPKNCGFDPPVGNNVHVTKSHDVLICWVTAKNNIMVTANDGQVTVRNSVAGNNIKVSRNKAFVADANDPKHNNVDAIRVLRNVADGHIHLFNNDDSRKIIKRKNSPRPVVK